HQEGCHAAEFPRRLLRLIRARNRDPQLAIAQAKKNGNENLSLSNLRSSLLTRTDQTVEGTMKTMRFSFEDFKKLCLWRWANGWSWFVQPGQNRIKCRSKAALGERLAMSAVQSKWSGSYHIAGPLCGTTFYRMNSANTLRRS